MSRTVHLRQRRLPHWTTDEGTYFVTFRLADAFSPELSLRIAMRRKPAAIAERLLDRGFGRCWLRDPRIASLVQHALIHFDERRYVLHAFVIMPNHVHVAFRTMPGFQLDEVLKIWKGGTA